MMINGETLELQRIQDALAASYDPRTSNEARGQTLQYLNDLKNQPEAPKYGFTLASDLSQQPFTRHFGLSLLETSIRYRWNEHSEEQAQTLRQWIITLARNVRSQDPAYFRNKVASLWADIAKREWAESWIDMDEMLAGLWNTSDNDKIMVNRVLVLCILETLSIDICVREDTIAMLRQEELGQALNEIMIPQVLFQKHVDSRGKAQEARFTQDGWLSRTCAFLSSLAGSYSVTNEMVTTCATTTLEALKPTLVWISLDAVLETNCVDCLFQTLAYGDESVQRVGIFYSFSFFLHTKTFQASVEVLYSILGRQYNPHFHDSWQQIFRSVLHTTRLEMLKRVFLSAAINADDIDDAKYTLQKKISEVGPSRVLVVRVD